MAALQAAEDAGAEGATWTSAAVDEEEEEARGEEGKGETVGVDFEEERVEVGGKVEAEWVGEIEVEGKVQAGEGGEAEGEMLTSTAVDLEIFATFKKL